MFFIKKKKPKSDSMTKIVEKCVFDRDFFVVGDVYVLKELGTTLFGLCTEVGDERVCFRTERGFWSCSPKQPLFKVVKHISIKDYE